MFKDKSWYFALVCMFALNGCGDDSSGTEDQTIPTEPECVSDEDCESGICQEDGSCAAKEAPPQSRM